MTVIRHATWLLFLVVAGVPLVPVVTGTAGAANSVAGGPPAIAHPDFVVHVPVPPAQFAALAPTEPGVGSRATVASPPAAVVATPSATPTVAAPATPPAPPVVPAEVDVHEAPRDRGRVEVNVDRGKTGQPDQVELDLPSLQKETEAIREALPDDSASTADVQVGPEFDIPIVVNRQVEWWMRYYQTVGRKHMALWLARSERYIPMMQAILHEHGLPADLVYLALIESGFSTSARSVARAVGPWQFIEGTGRRYGLRIDWWIDERRDPEKSTIAAATYLKDLHEMFDSWYLAAAGYNAGEGKIVRAIARYDTDDFWQIAERRYLRAETKQYVPKLIAAAIIAKSPEKYGFGGIEYHAPLAYDKVTVPDATDLRLIAQAAETTYEEIQKLNPELRRWATPPSYPGYEVNIPLGKKEAFERNFGKLAPFQRITYRRHVVRRGDTLSAIAARYGVDMAQVQRMNTLRGSLLRTGQSLVIPVPANRTVVASGDDEPRVAPGRRTVAAARRSAPKVDAGRAVKAARVDEPRAVRYTVKRGETLWDIAERHGVSLSALLRWNRFSRGRVLKAGDHLIIHVPADRPRKDARGTAAGGSAPA